MSGPIPDAAAWQRIAPYLDSALDLEAHARAAWLEELAAQQPDIAAVVRHMLEEREQLEQRNFLGRPVLDTTCAARAESRLGAYRLERCIGRGGMGEVWSARRCDGRFDGVYAIKLLAGPVAHSQLRERFQREGQLLARLTHPHIARLLDAGATATGRPYLVLEYVEGQRIDHYCSEHALPVMARVQLCSAVIAAVAHAHSRLVIHRDIKPVNVLVTHDGQAKLLDFGVAKLLEPVPALADAGVTRIEDAALTPEYAAPEQMLGEAPSTATDVYQLGMLLYVLLTERHPLVITGTRAERIRAALDGVIPPASQLAGTTALRKQLQGDLDAILAMAMRKVPSERYATAQALQDDLQRYLHGESVLARRGAAWYHARKFVARHRVGVLAGSAAVVALLLSTALALQQLWIASAQRDAAVLQVKRAEARSELAEFMMADADGAPDPQRLDRARLMIEQRFASEPRLRAGLLINLSGRYVDSGDSNMGTRLLEDAAGLARQLHDDTLLANISCGLAFDAINANDTAAAQRHYATAREHLQRIAVVSADLQAECAIAGADIARSTGDPSAAIALLTQALVRLEVAGMQRTARYTSAAHALARVHLMSGHYREAWRRAEQVLSIVAATGRSGTSAYQATLNIGASALLRGGRPQQAAAVIESAMTEVPRTNPAWQPLWVLRLTQSMAWSAMGDGTPRSVALMHYADVAQQQGSSAVIVYRCAAVRDAIERHDLDVAQALWSTLSPLLAGLQSDAQRHRDVARLLLLQAQLELAKQHPRAALPFIEQAAALVGEPRRARDTDPEAYTIAEARTEAALALEDFAAAARHAQLALDIATEQAVDPAASSSMGAALLLRARAEAGRGARAQAAATARQALAHLQATMNAGSARLRAAHVLANQ